MTLYADVWKDFPEIRAIYYVDGKPAPVGTVIRNPAYAKLLRDVAARGADAFYTGANAQAIVKAVTQAPRNQIGRASGRERVCQYGEISVVAVSVKKKKKKKEER